MTPHFPIYMDYGATTPVRPARRRRDDPLAARAFRQPGLAQPRLGLGGRGGGREGARPGRRADRRRPARDRLDLRCHRVQQPGAQGCGALLQRPRQAPRHRQDRAQGGARHHARARAPGLRGDLPRRAGERPARPRPLQGRAAPRHDPGLGDAREQRDRRDPGHPGHRRDVSRARHHLPRRRARRPPARWRSTWPRCRST